MSVYHSNKQWTTYRILDATVDNADLADPLNLGATGANEGKGFILWGDTSAAKIEWDETNDRLLTTTATIRMGLTDKLEFRDANQYIHSDAAGDLMLNALTSVALGIGGTAEVKLAANVLSPQASNGCALGATNLMWSDLFLASGGVIGWAENAVTITHSFNLLTISSNLTVYSTIRSTAGAIYAAGKVNAGSGFRTNRGGLITYADDIEATTGNVTACWDITSTQGNIIATLGHISAPAGTVTAGGKVHAGTGFRTDSGGLITTLGDIVATAGAVQAGTTVTAGTGISTTVGDIETDSGDLRASGLVYAGTGLRTNSGGVIAASGDITASTANVIAEWDITANQGDITATLGDITASAGAVHAAGKVNAGTGFRTDSGGLITVAGDIVTQEGNVEACWNVTSTQGNIIATLGGISAPVGAISAGGGITAGSGLQWGKKLIGNVFAVGAFPVALDLTKFATILTSTANGDALSIPDGITGQIVSLTYAAEAGAGDTIVITPDNLGPGGTITLTDLGDCCELIFDGTNWQILSNSGTLAG